MTEAIVIVDISILIQLAFLPNHEIEKIIQKEQLIPLGPNTITNPVRLKGHLAEIREKGYAISFEERVLGSTSIAAPILDYKSNAIDSISISGPITRFSKNKIPEFISLVKEAAEEISKRLGYLQK